jgi:GMP synthase-like glutamine amidotransferase
LEIRNFSANKSNLNLRIMSDKTTDHRNPKLLLISTQPPGVFKEYGVRHEREWFTEGLELDEPIPYLSAMTESLPEDVHEYDAYIFAGSKLQVEDNDPWMDELGDFIQALLDNGKSVLGICFSHQLISNKIGNINIEVGPNGPERGLIEIKLNEEGKADPLFNGLDSETLTFSSSHSRWVPQVPDGWTMLAVSSQYPNQAFKTDQYDGIVRTIQFHPDLPSSDIIQILKKRRNEYQGTEEEFQAECEHLRNNCPKENGFKLLMNFKNMVANHISNN